MDQAALAECTSEDLAAAVCQVQALENAVRSSLVELVRACDERKLWAEDGCPSIESWLAMRLGCAWRTAAELVRVSRSLEHRPGIAAWPHPGPWRGTRSGPWPSSRLLRAMPNGPRPLPPP